jgi:hypothetical protein
MTQYASVTAHWQGCAKELPREHIGSPHFNSLKLTRNLYLSHCLTTKSPESCVQGIFMGLVGFLEKATTILLRSIKPVCLRSRDKAHFLK